jgi:hypothetical protein
MPVKYTVSGDGSFVHIISYESVTDEDIVSLESALFCDESINPQASRFFEVMPGSIMSGTQESVLKKIQQKEERTKKAGHRCAVFAPFKDKVAWELADCYRVISELYSPNSIVSLFADIKTAQRWLGINGDDQVTG